MISKAELLVMGFLAFGGVIMLLPAVILEKVKVTGIIRMIGGFLLIIIMSAAFYLLVTDATLVEILTLKANSILLPKRIFSVSYTMILVFLVILPVAFLRNKYGEKDEKA